jgi:antitoxin PrlF
MLWLALRKGHQDADASCPSFGHLIGAGEREPPWIGELDQAGALDARSAFPYVRNVLTGSSIMITSKLTSKAQTTIPQPVRAALRVREGDALAYTIERDRVILTKASQVVRDDPFATFSEWASENDRRAYAGL